MATAPSMLTFPGIFAVPGLVQGVTTRSGGVSAGPYASLNLGFSRGDDAAAVEANRRRVGEALGSSAPPRFPRQVHGCRIVVLDDQPESEIGEADGIATSLAGQAVGVLGADCPGILIVDPVCRALAVVHCGWKGTLAGAARSAIETLAKRFGSAPADLVAGIGPGISARRYEVGPDVADAFRAGFPNPGDCLTPGRGDRSHLDLTHALQQQLTECGVRSSAISTIDICTYDDSDRFFSHRRDGPATGRHALVAMWTE